MLTLVTNKHFDNPRKRIGEQKLKKKGFLLGTILVTILFFIRSFNLVHSKLNPWKENQSEVVAKAKVIAAKYFKEKHNTDVVFTSHESFSDISSREISLHGHIKGHEDNKMYITLDYKNHYKVLSTVTSKAES